MELTHSASVTEMPMSRMIEGIATFTIVASTMIIETPSATNGIGRHLPRPVVCSLIVVPASGRRPMPTSCR